MRYRNRDTQNGLVKRANSDIIKVFIKFLHDLCTSFQAFQNVNMRAQAQLFTFETTSSENHIHTRNICMKESAESSEDPACGTGTAAIMAYLMKNYPGYSGNPATLHAEQGEIVQKPSLITCHGTTNDAGEMHIQISGGATLMQEGRFYL